MTWSVRGERLAVPIAIAGGVGFAGLLWVGQVGVGLIGAGAESSSQIFSDTTRSLGESGLTLLCVTLVLGVGVGRRWIMARRAAAVRRAHRALSLTALGVIGLGPTHFARRHRFVRWRSLHPWIVASVGLSALHCLGGG